MAEFDFTQAIGEARAKYESIAKALDVDRLKADIKDLETQAAAPGLWDDPENAQKITSRLSAAESQLKRLNSASQRIDDVETLVELGHEEGDQDSLDEAQSEIGEIQKLSPGIGPDRFDGNPAPHYHFICRHCGCVMDLTVSGLDHINILAGQDFDGEIEGHITYFYGACPSCKASEKCSS